MLSMMGWKEGHRFEESIKFQCNSFKFPGLVPFIPWNINSSAFSSCIPGHSGKQDPTPSIDVL